MFKEKFSGQKLRLKNWMKAVFNSPQISTMVAKFDELEWKRIKSRIPLIFVLLLTLLLIVGFYTKFQSSAGESVSVGDLGAYIAGAASPLLIIWLIYSIQIQSREMASQRQIRIYTTAQSILVEARQLMNAEIKQMASLLEIGEVERTVFDLDELPFTLSESRKFIELGKISFSSNAVLYQSAKNFVEIYSDTLIMLRNVDNTGRVEIFLSKSRYEFIERKLTQCMITSSGNT